MSRVDGSWIPIKNLASYNDEVLPETTEPDFRFRYLEISDVSLEGGVAQGASMSFSQAPSRARRIVRAGDVLVSTVRTYLRAIASVKDLESPTVASTGFAVLRARTVDQTYLKYSAMGQNFVDQVIARSTGVSYPAINSTDLVRIPIFLPSASNQRLIANYLDRETAEIDAFIADQERLIQLLNERSLALQLSATLGAGVTTPTTLGKVLQKVLRTVNEGSEIVTAFRSGLVSLRSTAKSEGYTLSEHEIGYQGVMLGDLVFHGLDGFAGAVGISDSVGKSSPVYHVCEVHSSCDPRFLALYIRSLGLSGYLEANAWSVRQRAVDFRNWKKFSALQIRLPSLQDQIKLRIMMDEGFSTINEALTDARRAIELSKERRAALISAAVTGQIDVSNA